MFRLLCIAILREHQYTPILQGIYIELAQGFVSCKCCANPVCLLAYTDPPWERLLIIAETYRSGSLFMDKCNLLVANLFMHITYTEYV